MELVPLIYVKNRKIHAEKDGKDISPDEVLERISKDRKIYVLDIDGIEKNKPNLCLYPKLSEHYEIWVDAGPRVLGDIVDMVMAGASNITVRKNLRHELEIPSIKDITERGIYVDVDLKSHNVRNIDFSLFQGVDGAVIFNDKNLIKGDFKSGGFLKSLCTRYKIYAYEPNPKNFSYWKTLGVTGILVDISKAEEF